MNIKKIILILFATILSNVANAQFESAELQVSGLTCSMCSKATEKSLRTLNFIQDIKADLNHASYLITFKQGSVVSMDQIAEKVKDAGFSVNKLVGYFNFKDLKVSNDYHFPYQNVIYHFMNSGDKQLKGKTALTFIDKSFVPQKDYNKYEKETKFECYKTGYLEKCCPVEKKDKTRIYHVMI